MHGGMVALVAASTIESSSQKHHAFVGDVLGKSCGYHSQPLVLYGDVSLLETCLLVLVLYTAYVVQLVQSC